MKRNLKLQSQLESSDEEEYDLNINDDESLASEPSDDDLAINDDVDDADTLAMPSLNGSDDSDDYESDDMESEASFEKGVRIYRRVDQPEIDPAYNSDSSDEETHNTTGPVPAEWYADYPHIGYDIDGKKILKPAKGDELDAFLSAMDDPNFNRTVFDAKENQNVVLTKEQMEIMKRIVKHEFPNADFDPYQPTVEWFTSKVEIHPLSNAPEPKRRFIPSKSEGKKIALIARAIKKGWIVPASAKPAPKPKVYALWDEHDEGLVDHPMHIPAPKLRLPQHNESYNPPAEYLLNNEELAEWNDLDPEDRPFNFIPKKHENLRSVGAYDRFIQERFERCLDLYLCPRMKKNRMNVDPESLIPKLPSPKDLRPFPTKLSITYSGHSERVKSISIDPTGTWLVSGSDDKTVRVWEISSGRCLKIMNLTQEISVVKWNPNKKISAFAIAHGNQISIVNPGLENTDLESETESILSLFKNCNDSNKYCSWEAPDASEHLQGYRLHIKLVNSNVSDFSWHRRGDYFATVSPQASNSSTLIHQLSKGQTQSPFSKSKGLIQKVLFHPSKPIFYVATQQSVRIYNLAKQQLVKKLQSGAKWISSMDIHPGGDNLIVGSYDRRLCWFDMDLSTKPYKTLRYHKLALRDVTFHKRYPLFASSCDDGSINIFHGMVYNDLMKNPLIVPVKTLQAHTVVNSLGALGCEFHPTQPWLVTCGADGDIKLFS